MVLKWIQAEEDHAEVEDCTAGACFILLRTLQGILQTRIALVFLQRYVLRNQGVVASNF